MRLSFLTFGIAIAAMIGAATAADKPFSLASQGSFFLGGRDIQSNTLSTRPNSGGTATVDQVYLRYQIPAKAGKHRPVTFIHGCCLTGKTWESTPDGRMGWDEFFLRAGHPVYVVDQAGRGRSALDPSSINAVKLGQAAADKLPVVSFATHEGAWTLFRFGAVNGETFPGLQFPLEAQAEFWKQMVPDWSGSLPTTPNPTVPALSELAARVKGTVLVSHSQSGMYPFLAAARSTDGIAGIVAIEPANCPAPTDAMAPYTKFPILVLFGDYLAQSPLWGTKLKECRAFMDAANAAGGKVEVVALPDVGFHGNSHMLMEDRNSLDIARWLVKWIGSHIG